ncbi:MAG TPA: HEAT repeat domain-containing protein [Polyangiaceae bacterium]|jgi:hypothetical protein|nr:HEAT repeat domain-containing protein [Polyangiaceae bacterium]
MSARWRRFCLNTVHAIAIAFILLLSLVAKANGRIKFLADRMMYPPAAGQPDDFRVRTNAALALGATDNDEAVAPLCAGLADPSEVVRQAAAVGLRRLARLSSISCLKGRASQETNASVRAAIERAIDSIQVSHGAPDAVAAAGNGGTGSGSAKYYVSLSRVTNKSSRPTAEVEQIVHSAIAAELEKAGLYQIAPSGETVEAAKATLARRPLKGYFLAISVEKFDSTDEGLRVRVKVAVFSYPGKDLRGEVPAGATLPGAMPGDKHAEDQLMGMVAARAAQLFAENFK